MWPALFFPVAILVGTLALERVEHFLLSPAKVRAKGKASSGLLWTVIAPPVERARPVPPAPSARRQPGTGPELIKEMLEPAPGVVPG